jgi:hypothetical protein
VKVNAAGTAFDYATYVAGSSTDLAAGIAVDASGAALIRGNTMSRDFPVTSAAYRTTGFDDGANTTPFLARLAPDGSRLVYCTFTGNGGEMAQALAVDNAGNAAIAEQGSGSVVSILRFDPQGALISRSRPLPPVNLPFHGEALTMDAAGVAYLIGFPVLANYPVKDSLAECGTAVFAAFDSAGNLLQSSYIGGAADVSSGSALAIAVGPDSTVYVAGPNGAVGDPITLSRLSPRTPARPIALVCAGNAASFDGAAIAPGEIVSLFGQGLGPSSAAQPDVSGKSGFPTALAGVRVTFDGIPAPLLYVQDGQINTIAPWRLAPGKAIPICVVYNGGQGTASSGRPCAPLRERSRPMARTPPR